MRRFFETEHGRYILGDAREVLKELPSNEFDVVMTDPPFFGKDRHHDTGDYEVFVETLPELHRVLKDGGWLLVYFPSNRLHKILADVTRYFEYKDRFVVEFKSTTTKGSFGDKRTLCLLAFANGRAKIRERLYTDVIPGFEDPFIVTLHPRSSMWKPTFATALILSKFLRAERPKLLDPFAGYGSIIIVAEKLGIEWTGIDIDPEKFKVAEKVVKENVPLSTARKLVEEELKSRS